MKALKLLSCFLFFIFHFSLSFGQSWLWARQGTTYSDLYSGVADTKSNIYISSEYFDSITFGSHHLTTSASASSYVIKYDSLGNIIWITQPIVSYTYPNNFLYSFATALDNKGGLYITGQIAGLATFGKYSVTTGINGYGYVPFLTKFDTNGTVLWAAQATNGGSSNDVGYGLGLTTDIAGNIYETGIFFDTLAFGTYSVKESVPNEDVFLVKYNGNGSVLWARQAGLTSGGSYSYVNWIGNDQFTNIYLTGFFTGTVVFGKDTLKTINNLNAHDFFLVKYDSSGNVLWAKQGDIPTIASGSMGYSTITDKANNIYFTGWFNDTTSFDGDTLKDNFMSFSGDIFLMKLDANGNLIWVKQSHHSSSTQRGWSGYVLSIDTFNNIYMTAGGESLGNGKMFFSKDTFSYTKNDPDPSIVLKLDTSGNILCSSFAISGGDDQSTLGVNPSGRYVYWCGDFQTTVILGKDTVIYYPNAGEFPFVARWQPCMCKISAFFSGKTNICRGEGTTLTGLGGTSYSWSTGSTEQSITVSPQVTTTYTLSATNGDCSGDTTITVTVEPLPSVNVCCNTTISAGDSVQLSASGGGSYVWYPSMGLSCDSCPNPIAKPSQTTTYTLIVTNDSGCTVETSVTVYIGEAGCGNVFVPDVFSPNQDGHNDVLYVRGNCIATMDFNVYDRWGNKVFESENTNNGWDGSHNGSPMNTATFVWYLKATLLDGTQLEKKGNVTLVR